MRRLILVTVAGCGRLGFGDVPPMTDPDACALVIDAGAARINFNTHRTITTTGGQEPVTYAIDTTTLASIDTTSGELAAFSTPGTITITASDAGGCAAEADLAIGGDLYWYVGGTSNMVPTAEVLRSTDGLDWTAVGMLPDERYIGALVAFRDRLWWVAGHDGTNPRPEIFVSDDGVSWSMFSNNAPATAASFGYTIFKDYFYLVGGNGNGRAVFRTADMKTWDQLGDLPDDNHGGSLAAVNGQLLYVGGHNSTVGLFDWILDYSDGNWTQVATMQVPREYAGVAVVNDRLYMVGGQNTTPTSLTAVSSTGNGTDWTADPPLPMGRAFTTVLAIGGALFSIGGTDLGGVWRATPGGAWTNVPSQFPAPRQGGRTAVFTPP